MGVIPASYIRKIGTKLYVRDPSISIGYPTIVMDSAGAVSVHGTITTNAINFGYRGTNRLHLTIPSGTTTIEGPAVTSHDLIIKATTIDSYPYIKLFGDGTIAYVSKSAHLFYQDTNNFATLEEVGGDGGGISLKEGTTPGASANWGKIYTKNDNELYFQDGAGNEKTVTTV